MRGDDFMEGLRRKLISRVDPTRREAVERDLDRLSSVGAASFQEVLAVARDPKSPADTRAIAVWCLGQARELPPRTRGVMIEILEAETDESVVWELAKAIAASPDPEERPELADRLSRLVEAPQPSEKRIAIVFALGLLGEERALAPLSRVLAEISEMLRVGEHAAEALANLARPAAAEILIAASARALDLQVALVRALGEIADPRVAAHLEGIADSAQSLHREALLALARLNEGKQDP